MKGSVHRVAAGGSSKNRKPAARNSGATRYYPSVLFSGSVLFFVVSIFVFMYSRLIEFGSRFPKYDTVPSESQIARRAGRVPVDRDSLIF
jgi:hypothetical protein